MVLVYVNEIKAVNVLKVGQLDVEKHVEVQEVLPRNVFIIEISKK